MSTLTKLPQSVREDRIFNRRRVLIDREYEAANMVALKGILSYLKYLYTEGEISDKAYRVLVSQVLSTFVENTVSFKIERVSDYIDAALREASEVLLSDILI